MLFIWTDHSWDHKHLFNFFLESQKVLLEIRKANFELLSQVIRFIRLFLDFFELCILVGKSVIDQANLLTCFQLGLSHIGLNNLLLLLELVNHSHSSFEFAVHRLINTGLLLFQMSLQLFLSFIDFDYLRVSAICVQNRLLSDPFCESDDALTCVSNRGWYVKPLVIFDKGIDLLNVSHQLLGLILSRVGAKCAHD